MSKIETVCVKLVSVLMSQPLRASNLEVYGWLTGGFDCTLMKTQRKRALNWELIVMQRFIKFVRQKIRWRTCYLNLKFSNYTQTSTVLNQQSEVQSGHKIKSRLSHFNRLLNLKLKFNAIKSLLLLISSTDQTHFNFIINHCSAY